jgi:hypothetical protein
MMAEPSTELEERLGRVAIGIFQHEIFRPAKDYHLQPTKGTLLHKLWSSKRLSERHQRAWRLFTTDLRNAVGKSGRVVSSYGEAIQSSGDSFKVPTARVNAEYRRVERLSASLTRDEKVLLMDLITDELQQHGELRVEDIGLATTGYRDAEQARAAGVATVVYLLQRIASFYEV